MSNLQAILDRAREAADMQTWLYGDWTPGIARKLGAPEVLDIIRRLDALEQERDEVPAWDGDADDDVWQMQRNFSRLLAAVARRYPAEVCTGLASARPGTRRWTALAIEAAPAPEFVAPLEQTLSAEPDENTARMLAEALEACREPRSFFARLPGR
jgi:hypothetical protein